MKTPTILAPDGYRVMVAPHRAGGQMLELNGVIPVDKPVGPTSHDAVAVARRSLGIRRIGHTGTLDPFASGLLLLCVGVATRLAEYLTPLPKRYLATLRLGVRTDTDDPSGETVATNDAWTRLAVDDVRAALEAQVGTRDQLPPVYSAKKVAGERMYALARRGATVERKPARVTIHALHVLDVRLPDVTFEVECSAGTYIRAIARDAGESLGVGAHLRELRRTATGGFEVGTAVPLDQLGNARRVAEAIVPPAAAVSHLAQVTVGDADARAIAQGRAIARPAAATTGTGPLVILSGGELLAIAEAEGERLKPRKVFA